MKAVRSCAVCGKKHFKFELIRLVRNQSGKIFVDPTQTAPGRGAYICPELACTERLGKRKELDRAFRTRVDAELYEKIRPELENMVKSTKIFSFVGLAFRAGKVAVGTAAVEEALHKKRAKLLILAEDISVRSEKHFKNLTETTGIQILRTGTKTSWGKLFGRRELGVLVILDVHFAKGILEAEKN